MIPARPTLTDKQKLTIMARYCRCPGVPEMGIVCHAHLPRMQDCEFDHIGQRSLTGDDSLENYRPLCPSCHKQKTHGPGGERRATTAGSDANKRAKARRIPKKLAAHHEAMERKEPGKSGRGPSRWPKRRMRT